MERRQRSIFYAYASQAVFGKIRGRDRIHQPIVSTRTRASDRSVFDAAMIVSPVVV